MHNFDIKLLKPSKLLLCYISLISALACITIEAHVQMPLIKLILIIICYINLMWNLAKHIYKLPESSILEIHYKHPGKWQGIYADGTIHNITIDSSFISQILIILNISNIAENTKGSIVIPKDQLSSEDFNKLHAAVSLTF